MFTLQNKTCHIDSFALTAGGESGDLAVDVCLFGDPSKPLVVLMGGISANRWALDVVDQNISGWWNQVVHDKAYFNPADFCFLTFEYFAFPDRVANPPLVSTTDQAKLLRRIQQQFDLPQFHAVIGSSYGGMVSLAFAARYPDALQHLLCVAAADRNSVKTQALRHIQRQILQLGQSLGATDAHPELMALARALAMVGYRGEIEWEQRFGQVDPVDSLTAVGTYLSHHGQRFAGHFSASRYQQLSRSIDHHHVDVSCIKAATLLIGVTTDQMVPPEFIQRLYQQLTAPKSCRWIDSIYGHDGFLLEADQLDQIFTSYFSEQTHDYFEQNSRRASGY